MVIRNPIASKQFNDTYLSSTTAANASTSGRAKLAMVGFKL